MMLLKCGMKAFPTHRNYICAI